MPRPFWSCCAAEAGGRESPFAFMIIALKYWGSCWGVIRTAAPSITKSAAPVQLSEEERVWVNRLLDSVSWPPQPAPMTRGGRPSGPRMKGITASLAFAVITAITAGTAVQPLAGERRPAPCRPLWRRRLPGRCCGFSPSLPAAEGKPIHPKRDTSLFSSLTGSDCRLSNWRRVMVYFP